MTESPYRRFDLLEDFWLLRPRSIYERAFLCWSSHSRYCWTSETWSLKDVDMGYVVRWQFTVTELSFHMALNGEIEIHGNHRFPLHT